MAPICVYTVCMARLNVYVPHDLAARAREAGLNVSAITQSAIAAELERHSVDAWLDGLPTPRSKVTHEAVLAALDEARVELDGARR